MAVARSVCPAFQVYPETRETINDIFSWCLRLPGKLDPDKGLWLWGNIGTGKSTMLPIIREFCRRHRRPSAEMLSAADLRKDEIMPNDYWFRICRAKDVCADFATNGYAALDRYVYDGRIAFDDLGAEPRLTSHYGSVLNVIEEILHRRYDYRNRNFTHITTNFKPCEIAANYGQRVADRCGEMFNFVHFGEYSNRPETPANETSPENNG